MWTWLWPVFLSAAGPAAPGWSPDRCAWRGPQPPSRAEVHWGSPVKQGHTNTCTISLIFIFPSVPATVFKRQKFPQTALAINTGTQKHLSTLSLIFIIPSVPATIFKGRSSVGSYGKQGHKNILTLSLFANHPYCACYKCQRHRFTDKQGHKNILTLSLFASHPYCACYNC